MRSERTEKREREEREKRKGGREREKEKALVGGQVHPLIRSECSSDTFVPGSAIHSLSQLGETVVSFLPKSE